MAETASRHNRLDGVLTVGVYVGSIILFVTYANLSLSHVARNDDYRLTEITILHPWVGQSTAWCAFVGALVLLLLAQYSFRRPLLRHPIVGLLLALGLYPFCFLMHTGSNLGPWTLHGQLTSDDGSRYVFCNSSFLQGQMMALAKADESDTFSNTYHVLVENNGDSPRSWASLIRPAKSADNYGQLYLCPSNILVGVRYENHCYLAYDLEQQVAIGHGDIEQVSPFLCLDTKTPINVDDVGRTLRTIKKYAELYKRNEDVRLAAGFLTDTSIPGCPSVDSVRVGLEHTNEEVRQVAQRILTCYTDSRATLIPRVELYVDQQMARLESDNSRVRLAASEALGGLGPAASRSIPTLAKIVQSDDDPSVRRQASQTLGLIGSEAIPTLLSLTLVDDTPVQDHALFGLRAAEPSACTPLLIEFLEANPDTSSSGFRTEAARLLESLKRQPDR